jgi:UDP-glucose 4-epimerase
VTILDDLSTGHLVNAPAAARVVVGDVRDAAQVGQLTRDADGCFHLAAIASVFRANEDWQGTHAVNQTGTVNVLNAARNGRGGQPVPVVYASSAAVYGDAPIIPLSEREPTYPLTAYGADKLGSEIHARVAWTVHGVPTTGLRFFNVYGPRQDPRSPYSGVISVFVDRIGRGKAITLFGNGRQTRDFVFVADVVAHLQAAMNRTRNGANVFNVCTGHSVSILELAQTIGRLAGCRPRLIHADPRPGDIRVSLGDPGAAIDMLGVVARTSLEEGLRHTLNQTANALPLPHAA